MPKGDRRLTSGAATPFFWGLPDGVSCQIGGRFFHEFLPRDVLPPLALSPFCTWLANGPLPQAAHQRCSSFRKKDLYDLPQLSDLDYGGQMYQVPTSAWPIAGRSLRSDVHNQQRLEMAQV